MLREVLRLIVLNALTILSQIELSSVCFDYDAVVLTLQFCCHDENVDDDSLLKDDDVKAVVYANIEVFLDVSFVLKFICLHFYVLNFVCKCFQYVTVC